MKTPKKRASIPSGGNDDVMTPDSLALALIRHFQPFGLLLDPCCGEGAFCRAWMRYHKETQYTKIDLGQSYDIKTGVNFLEQECQCEERYTWIITNPPWSKFLAFLKKAMELADNVVFLANLNAWTVRARLNAMQAAGFEFVQIALVSQPPRPWPQMGLQLAAVHIRRHADGFSGFGTPYITTLDWMRNDPRGYTADIKFDENE